MILVNGERREDIAATDRGLHYGDGLFETIAIVDGHPRLWSEHMDRLASGCKALGLPLPDNALLYDEILAFASGQSRAVVKLLYTRGSGGRGYRPPQVPEPQRLLFLYPWPDYTELSRGMRLRLCRTPLGCNPALAGIKHLNRLEQVLARREWDDPGIHEGLMCDTEGFLRDGTMSNLFWVSGQRLFTPDLQRCGVAGVMRGQVLKAAKSLGIEANLVNMPPDTLYQADEVFMTNALMGIKPVVDFEGHSFSFGEFTRALIAQVEGTG